MNIYIQRICDAGQLAWIKFLSNLNKLMMMACAGIVMLNQVNPNFVNSLTNSLTKTQQAIAAFAFCTIVQFAIAQTKKAAQ